MLQDGRLNVQTAGIFHPLTKPARYKGAWGGRGSGKSHFFAELLVRECIKVPGTRAVCIREVQRTLSQSSKTVIEDKIEQLGVAHLFRVLNDQIITPGNGVILFVGMQDYSTGRHSDSIKSLEGCRIAWVEEAQTLSARSLSVLRPTIRLEGSEIWFSWNPTRESDAVDEFLRQKTPDDAIVVPANHSDNPWFPDVLEQERQLDLSQYPERYDHVWEGGYAKAFEGAYFAKGLEKARQDGRICKLTEDEMLTLYAFWDIGGAGKKADLNSIWIVQFVNREIQVLDYIEGQGQVLAYYVGELQSKGYRRALCVLPHDGVNTNNLTGKRFSDHLEDAGFEVETVTNQGPGAAKMRIEAVRRIMPFCYFDETKTQHGRSALGFYHERRDAQRNVGLGPEHDWSSNAADAFGLMAIRYEAPKHNGGIQDGWRPTGITPGQGGWMGA